MSTITFPLKAKQRGNAVLHLQDGLLLLIEKNSSIFIPPPPLTHIPKPPDWPAIINSLKAERSKKYYGKTTGGLITAFQKTNRLKAKGIVNKPTAEALNRLIDAFKPAPSSSKYSVSGRIRRADNSPFGENGHTVQAFDQINNNKRVSLGTTPLPPNGRYLIPYDWKPSDRHKRPNLLVRLLDPQGNIVAESTKPNTAARSAVNLTIKRPVETPSDVDVNRSFTITGAVKLISGKIKKRQKLLAFDLDLRGVAVYRNVKNIAEIKKNKGFEPLGETASDNLGNYKITFYERQYRKAERGKADVVVYALEGNTIVGQTRMVKTEDYSAKGLIRGLDLVINQEDKRTEYEILMDKLEEFLEESETSLGEIVTSEDQLAFIAGELDIDLSHINIVASATLLEKYRKKMLSHELLYGIGRQNIRLIWSALYKRSEDELREAVAKSEDENIIQKISAKELAVFIQLIRKYSVSSMLDDQESDDKNTLNIMLSHALPNEKQRLSFVDSFGSFRGSDFSEFWNQYLPEQAEFKNKPELISGLLFTQQLTVLTGNHQTLVSELQVNNQLTSADQLLDFKKDDWLDILQKTGVPDSITGKDEAEKIDRYTDLIQGMLNAAFPTQRIQKMLQKNELKITGNGISNTIRDFLAANETFDFAGSRIHDFSEAIQTSAGENFDIVNRELMKIQRVFQVSATPDAMSVLMENNLDSAYKIANIPRKSFIKTYSLAMGGEDIAFVIHQRASYISTKTELSAMHIMEYSHAAMPGYVMGKSERKLAMTALQQQVPNYAALFGSPDVCECKQCRSVYSAAAYFVDMLRFLSRGSKNDNNDDNKNRPLNILTARRPDLLHLPLTCENTNTIIPYIDLVNEVMEYYAANNSLESFEGHNTGETIVEELRANPQNSNIEAYRKLKDAKYPFTLPYHQPLDAIRIYSDQLGVSRYDVLKAINPVPDIDTSRAIAAESLKLSQEEYAIYTGETFNSTIPDTSELQTYFGYPAAAPERLEELSRVREFLKRSGIAYTDLVELVKTRFINPYQNTLVFLEKIFSYASIDASTIYTKLGQIEAGTLDPADDTDIVAALNNYNSATGTNITPNQFAQWVTDNLGEFSQVITLFEPDSKCNLETTQLKTIQSIYEGSAASGIANDSWSKIHRFIRLWLKLGWTIHETDLMLAALGEEITPETISKLEFVVLLKAVTKRSINELAVLWGNIDTYGEASLYKKLFFNKAIQQIDPAFKADAMGNYLQSESEVLENHISTIVAAFKISEEDLSAIRKQASLVKSRSTDPLDIATDILNLQNISTLYRYVMLAKALRLKVTDVCKLITIFKASPFSQWDIDQEKFINISPKSSYEFYRLATATRSAGFKSAELEYIFNGSLPADSTLGLDKNKGRQTAQIIIDAFAVIEQKQPTTSELLKKELQKELVVQHVATLIGLGPGIVTLLIADDIDLMITNLSADTLDIENFVALNTIFHRAAKFILGFKLSGVEFEHFIAFNENFDGIDFKALNVVHWQRVYNYTNLRNAVPQAQASLIDVFKLAGDTPPPTVEDRINRLHLATAWDKTNLNYLATHFSLAVGDFNNEIKLNQIHEVMKIVSKTGLSAETITKWGTAEAVTVSGDTVTGFEALNNTSQLLKHTLKAKYEIEDWLDLAANLNDKIRENQRQALVSYLLVHPAIREAGVKDADSLFEYFLIDVQMGACMDTSRIVQANAAIQMFVNRCLLNLESVKVGGLEMGVSPGAIDKDRWQWMKNYRVWEANRKVFLYPENWLEPEWRNDRSEFFKDLESYLVQNDITERSVEQGLRNYLTSLNEVANLEICGTHQESYADGRQKFLHVFARTNTVPYKFFYRRWNEHKKWSAWEKVQLDIRSVEGIDGGVHLIPVVWKERLFLFWPEFMEKQEAATEDSSHSTRERAEDPMSSLEPRKYLEIRLAWSEYVDGKWSPKQLSREFARQTIFSMLHGGELSEKDFIFTASVSQELIIKIGYDSAIEHDLTLGNKVIGGFRLSDIQSPVATDVDLIPASSFNGSNYTYAFSKRATKSESKLKLLDNVYLKNKANHKLLPVDTFNSLNITLNTPFFFSDVYRTYFVRPVDIPKINRIKNPELYEVYVPEWAYKDDYTLPEVSLNFSNTEPPPLVSSRLINASMDRAVSSETTTIKSGNSILDKYAGDISLTQKAFNSPKFTDFMDWQLFLPKTDKGLEFHTFYHPFSSQYVTRLNQGGIPALMGSDTENPSSRGAIKSDDGLTFKRIYDPNFANGLVKRASNFDTPPDPRTAYKENVCFDVYGANSLYNWELFFHAPLYIATRLSKNGKYEEAMKWFHYIFDPTTDEMPQEGESEISRYWKVLLFKTEPSETLETWFKNNLSNNPNPSSAENVVVAEWRDNPFDPHLVASNRPLAYMKHVVIKYVENLVAWGDSLFRQFTRESVNESLQLYVIANHILGPRPEFVPKRGEIKAESYNTLQNKLDDFSNALVELENIFPYSSETSISDSSPGSSLLGIGRSLYFCIPANDKLFDHWDTVADRLFKIRHCQDIDGVERKLALFAPPIDPALLIQATSQGLNLSDILADLSSPPPIYRFTYLIQKANEFCGDVRALGSALLAALEKKDGEELGRLRASQEINMLELVTAIRERQVLDARVNREGLLKSRETTEFRLQHYTDLLGNESVTVPAVASIDATLTADSQLPEDTNIEPIEIDVDDSLVESGESGVKLIPRERDDLDKSREAMYAKTVASAAYAGAGIANFFPSISGQGQPLGVGVSIEFGGQHVGAALSALAKVPEIVSTVLSYESNMSSKMASYIRREQDWTLQANLAALEIVQLDKQITSADIRIQIAEKELENHKQQIDNAKEVELFLKNKFTNQELYQWMKEQLFSVYKQSYNLAFDMAKRVEKAYQYEMGAETASFIQYGYWDNSKQGLVAGEKLQLALRQIETSYLEGNRRELELTKSISLVMLNPLALIQLRETGKCYLSLPEELFDLDFQGHYFRRIKSVSLSIPCITGPYTTVNCSLRLLNNSTRINTAMNSLGDYERNNDEGLLIDDVRFRSSNVPVTSIATSTAQNDAGMFEFNFRDERYLPFEGAGAISEWQIELSTEKELRQFDYSTISDVILHCKYTARENGGLFKNNAVTYIKSFIMKNAELEKPPLMRMFSMKQDFPTEWNEFLHPRTDGSEQVLALTLGKKRFPFFAQERDINVVKIDLFIKSSEGDYNMVLSHIIGGEGETLRSSKIINMPKSDTYGGLNKATINATNDVSLNLEKLDITKEMRLKVTSGLDKVEDIFVVLHYFLSDDRF